MKKSGPMAPGGTAALILNMALAMALAMALGGCAGGAVDLGAPYTADAPGVKPGQLLNPNPNLTTPPTVQPSDMQWLRWPQPAYPAAAKLRREQGTVVIRALVNTQGLPAEVNVFRSSGYPELDQAAVQAIWSATCRPYLRNGSPVAVYVQSPITFLLNN